MATKRAPAAKPKAAAKKAPARRTPPKKAAAAKAARAKAPAKRTQARRAAAPRRPASSPPPSPPAAPADAGWIPVEEPSPAAWPASAGATAAAARPAPPAFDPATGAWLPAATPAWVPVGQAGAEAEAGAGVPADAPEAPATGTTRKIVWDVLLYIDLALLAFNFLLALVVGAILVFAPDSAQAEEFREGFESGGSQALLVIETLLVLVLMGVIPLLWAVYSRRGKWEGAKRYLQLHSPAKAFAQGIGLTVVLLLAVMVLSVVYILVTEGPEGLTLAEEEGDNPAVDALLEGLTWPVAVLVAFTAGVGEEILFRGVLLRKIGMWPQAVLFGLAHAAGGYLPQILFAFGLAVFFGYLTRRGVSLYALMTAHFLYDMTLLSIGIVYA